MITDKHHSYKSFAKDNPKIKYKILLAKDQVDENNKTVHLQRANNTQKQVRYFLKPLKGINSKYLQNYLNWDALHEQDKKQ